jgi:membrane protein
MLMTLRQIGRLVKEAGMKFVADEGSQLGAAIAFYMALSLSPLLLVMVAVAGLAFGEEAARGEIVTQLRDTVGKDSATVIEQLVAQSAGMSGGVVAAVIAFVVLCYGASGVFTQLQSALNTIWRVPGQKAAGGILSILRDRLFSFLLVCGTILLLLLSLVISAILSGIHGKLAGWVPQWSVLVEVSNFVLGFVLITILFAMIFKWLPNTRLAWSDVWLGAAITAGLFSVGKYLIGLYLGNTAIGSAYGAAGAFVLLLLWVYYSSQIVLFGAEFTFIYAQRKHKQVGGNAPSEKTSPPVARVQSREAQSEQTAPP